jgi:hypothetical protein
MPSTPTPLAKATRFFQPGVSKIIYIPTAVNYLTPTTAEITAGKDLSGELTAINGFTTTSNNIPTGDFNSRFGAVVAGTITADDSSLEFNGDKSGADVRTVLPRDTVGYILFMDGGNVSTTGKMDVFPITVSSLAKQRGNSDSFKILVSFAITAIPAEDVTIP